jgi:hypothetical protein
VGFSEANLVFASAAARSVEVQLRANQAKVTGELRIEAPTGWRVEPAMRQFTIEESGRHGNRTVHGHATRERIPPATYRAVARVGGIEIHHDMRIIDYEHIPAQTVFKRVARRALSVLTRARFRAESDT